MPPTVPVNVGDANGANPAMDAPVGIVTVPVNVGDANGANPAMDAPVGIVTVPVNVGLAIGASVAGKLVMFAALIVGAV
jgi:hypothetical protein